MQVRDSIKNVDVVKMLQTYPLFTHCRTLRRNCKFLPSLLTSGLNSIPVYAAALIKQCLIQKITAGSHWVELIWYLNLKNIFASLFKSLIFYLI